MNPLAHAVSAGLVHSIWQDGLLAAALWAALFVLRDRPPTVRYAVSCGALGLMAAWPLSTMCVLYLRSIALGRGVPVANSPVMPAINQAIRLVTGEWVGVAPQIGSEPLLHWVFPVWCVGVFAFSLRLLTNGAHAFRLERHGEAADSLLTASASRVAERLGLPYPVRVLVSDALSGPATLGWWRPVVLIPPAAILGLSPEHLDAVLAHELAHLRRHDYLVNVVQMIVETLFFYHPAIWWASHRIRLERELCCDDVAVGACGNPVCYAQALTRLARLSLAPPAVAMSATGGPLVHRVRRVLGAPVPELRVATWPAVFAVVVALGYGALQSGQLWAQSSSDVPNADLPRFDVISIKLNTQDGPANNWSVAGRRFNGVKSQPLALIQAAWGDFQLRVENVPSWFRNRYDLIANAGVDISVAPSGHVGPLELMIRAALVDRFKLAAHLEKRQISVYSMVMTRADHTFGPKLEPAMPDCPLATGSMAEGACGPGYGGYARGAITFGNMPMTNLAELLSRMTVVGRRVVDNTGLPGGYKVDLRYNPWQLAPAPADNPAPVNPDAPGVFTALEEQLGLKLVPSTGQVDVLVIDHIEEPSPN